MLSNNNKRICTDLTRLLYHHICKDYKTSHCRSCWGIVSSVLSHWHIIQKLYTSSKGTLVSCRTLLRNNNKKNLENLTYKQEIHKESQLPQIITKSILCLLCSFTSMVIYAVRKWSQKCCLHTRVL